MPLVMANGWLEQVQIFREAWLKGRKGGGKTLLAFATAKEFIDKGLSIGCVSNIGHGLAAHPWDEMIYNALGEETPRLIRDAFVVYDEPWVNLDNRTSLTNDRTYGAGGRKFNTYVMFPSFIPIDKRLSYLQCQRTAQFSVPILQPVVAMLNKSKTLLGDGLNTLANKIPALTKVAQLLVILLHTILRPISWLGESIWVYRWSVEQGESNDAGTFFLTKPSEYYNLYDTADFPLDDGDIGELWKRTIMESKRNDIAPGRWWLEEGVNPYADLDRRTGNTRSTVLQFPGTHSNITGPTTEENQYSEENDETTAYASTRADRYHTAEIRTIAEPVFGRATPHYADEEY